jgi:hypothetical protein
LQATVEPASLLENAKLADAELTSGGGPPSTFVSGGGSMRISSSGGRLMLAFSREVTSVASVGLVVVTKE